MPPPKMEAPPPAGRRSGAHAIADAIDCPDDTAAQADSLQGAIIVDLSDARLRRDVELLHRLGPRPMHELLVELGRKHPIRVDIEDRVARYARLDPELLCMLRVEP
jgi:hypothetical protein